MRRPSETRVAPAAMAASLVAILTVGATAQRAPAQVGALEQLPERERAGALRWLMSNCADGEELRLENEMRRLGVRLEPAFLEAAEKGPDDKLVGDVVRAAEEQYRRRQERLKDAERLGLSDADLRAARGETRAQFLDRAKSDFVLRYKSQAVLGLGVVGGERAGAYLRRTARDEASPLRSTAEEALKKYAPNDPGQAGGEAIKKEWASLNGNWSLARMEIRGKSLLAHDRPAPQIVIRDGKVGVRDAPQDVREVFSTFRIDPGRKPKALTATYADGKLTLLGSYALAGDELKVWVETVETAKVRERPNEAGGDKGLLLVFRRAAK